MAHARLTYNMINEKFDLLDRRESQMRGFYRSLSDPNLSTAVPEALSSNFDQETTAAMEKAPMQALTNFGMGYMASFKVLTSTFCPCAALPPVSARTPPVPAAMPGI
jgi:hypothetical protein